MRLMMPIAAVLVSVAITMLEADHTLLSQIAVFALKRRTFKWTHPRAFRRSAHHRWGAESTEFDFSSDALGIPSSARLMDRRPTMPG
jgi:hypothetical protein